MTLIITTLADDAVTQIADMRLTYPDGSLASDRAVKSIYFVAADARVSISYTGLARLGLPLTAQTTDHWLVDFLTSSQATNKRLPDVVTELQTHAADTFSKFKPWGRSRAITFALAGFGPSGVFAVFVSNYEDGQGKRLRTLNDAFAVDWYFRNEKRMSKVDVFIHGEERAVSRSLKVAIEKVRKRGLARSPEERVASCVALLRRAANDEKYGRRVIGRDCISSIVTPQYNTATAYHSESSEPVSYAPHYVGPEFSLKDIFITSDPKLAGWVD